MRKPPKSTLSYDMWRHERMRNLVSPVINKKEDWLTVGDNQGTDAQYLVSKGVKNIVASDITIKKLKKNKKNKRYIFEIKKENAEHINYKDDSFDYVLCKESFHHFSRPLVGLYEMLRVARKGVVLIEPNDFKAFNDHKYVNQYETVGTYVYRISKREIEKTAYSSESSLIAYKGIDDIYLEKQGYLPYSSHNFKILFSRLLLVLLNLLTVIKVREHCLVCVIIFKTKPSKNTMKKLANKGFKIKEIIRNPYKHKRKSLIA